MTDHQKEELKKKKSPEVIAAEKAVEKAREKLARIKKTDAKNRRDRRDTAIFTIGAMFNDLWKRDEARARAIYDELLDGVNAKLFYDNRRVALERTFGLEAPLRPEGDS